MLHDLGRQPLHLCGLLGAVAGQKFVQVIVYRDLLVVEHEVQQEQVVHCHEGDRVDKAAGVQERLEVVVLLVLLDVIFKLVDVEVALCVPHFVLEVVHVGEGFLTCKATS